MKKKQRIFCSVATLAMAVGMFGATTVSAFAEDGVIKEESSANSDYVTTAAAILYTEQQTAAYGGGTYRLEVKMNVGQAIDSFDMVFNMPYYTTIVGVTETLSTGDSGEGRYEFSYTDTMVDITYSSANSLANNATLFVVEYVVNQEGTFADSPWASIEEIVADNGEIVVNYQANFGSIIVTPSQQEPTRMMGDMDGDNDVDLADLITIQRSLVYHNEGLTEEQWHYADINKDGRVSIADCQWIQKYLAGMISSLENIGGSTEQQIATVNIEYLVNEKGVFHNIGGNYGQLFELGRPLNEIAEKTIYNSDGIGNYHRYVGLYKDPQCTNPVTDEEVLQGNITLYALFEGKGSENENEVGVEVAFYQEMSDGTMVPCYGTRTQYDLGQNLREIAKNNFFNSELTEWYTFVDVYTDSTFTSILDSDAVVEEDCVVYVKMRHKDMSGTYTLMDGETGAEIGTVLVEGDTMQIEDSEGTGKVGTCYFQRGVSYMIVADTEMFVIQFQKIATGELGNGTVTETTQTTMVGILVYYFDGSDFEDTAEYSAVAGQYTILDAEGGFDDEIMTYQCTLYASGVYKLTMGGISIIGQYYVDGEVFTFNQMGYYLQARRMEESGMLGTIYGTHYSYPYGNQELELMDAGWYYLINYETGEVIVGKGYESLDNGNKITFTHEGQTYTLILENGQFYYEGDEEQPNDYVHTLKLYDHNGNYLTEYDLHIVRGQSIVQCVETHTMNTTSYLVSEVYYDSSFTELVGNDAVSTQDRVLYVIVKDNSTNITRTEYVSRVDTCGNLSVMSDGSFQWTVDGVPVKGRCYVDYNRIILIGDGGQGNYLVHLEESELVEEKWINGYEMIAATAMNLDGEYTLTYEGETMNVVIIGEYLIGVFEAPNCDITTYSFTDVDGQIVFEGMTVAVDRETMTMTVVGEDENEGGNQGDVSTQSVNVYFHVEFRYDIVTYMSGQSLAVSGETVSDLLASMYEYMEQNGIELEEGDAIRVYRTNDNTGTPLTDSDVLVMGDTYYVYLEKQHYDANVVLIYVDEETQQITTLGEYQWYGYMNIHMVELGKHWQEKHMDLAEIYGCTEIYTNLNLTYEEVYLTGHGQTVYIRCQNNVTVCNAVENITTNVLDISSIKLDNANNDAWVYVNTTVMDSASGMATIETVEQAGTFGVENGFYYITVDGNTKHYVVSIRQGADGETVAILEDYKAVSEETLASGINYYGYTKQINGVAVDGEIQLFNAVNEMGEGTAAMMCNDLIKIGTYTVTDSGIYTINFHGEMLMVKAENDRLVDVTTSADGSLDFMG